jgi:uncharacterized membrane protein (UPF0136 family)
MRKMVVVLALLLPVLVIFFHLDQFPFISDALYSDLLVSHYPNAQFVQKSILEWGQIPLWSPLILGGYPFAANPLSGIHYLPGMIALLFPLPMGFNLMVSLHLLFGGLGMYLFLRSENLSSGASLLGAVLFESMPKIFSHYGAGHLTLVYAVCWTPWLLYAERKSEHHHRIRWLLPGLVLGIIVLADIRWFAYAVILWLAYSLRNRLALGQINGMAQGWKLLLMDNWLITRVSNLIFAALIGAPVILPLLEYTRLSTRANMTTQENFILSLPPGQLFGLVYPYIGGMAEWVLYPGAAAFALALYALSMPLVRQRAGFWFILGGATLIYSLGSNIPYLSAVASLPGLDLLRVPPRMLFLTGLCFAVIAAYALQSLHWRIEGREWAVKDLSGLVLFGVTSFTAIFAGAVWLVVDQPQTRLQFAWGGVFMVLATGAIFLARTRKIAPAVLTGFVLLISLLDLVGVNTLSLEFRPAGIALEPENNAAAYIQAAGSKSPYRVFSPSYSIPQQVAAGYGLELADGVDPLQLSAYVDFMQGATGVPAQGYSVTLPPYASGTPETDNSRYSPDPALLGLLNVRYVVAEFPLDESQLALLARFGRVRVYQNLLELPRAWVQPSDQPLGEHILHEPWLVTRPNWVLLKARGPGLLVLSELAYPGWQVFVNEQPEEIETVENLLRGVQLPEGEHTVKFVFHPVSVYTGWGLSLFGWLMALALLIKGSRR